MTLPETIKTVLRLYWGEEQPKIRRLSVLHEDPHLISIRVWSDDHVRPTLIKALREGEEWKIDAAELG